MIRLNTAFVLVLLCVALLAGPCAARVTAQDDSVGHSLSNAYWVWDCADGVGVVAVDVRVDVPTGYVVTSTWSRHDPHNGDTREAFRWVIEDWRWSWAASDVDWFIVPQSGWSRSIYDVYAPDGTHVSNSGVYADCVTGDVYAWGSDITDVREPSAEKRMMGTVIVASPVFAEPSPDAALPGTLLRVGQEWFVVQSTTGTDGHRWYKVYVGGPRYGWVPAAALDVPGDVPGDVSAGWQDE